jgi:hypothetical protein
MPAFGEWTPDQLDLDGASSRVARNVYAKSNSYGPVPSAQVYGTATLPAKCVGFASYRTGSGGWGIVAGTKTALYKYSGGAWVVSPASGGAYNVPMGICGASPVRQPVDRLQRQRRSAGARHRDGREFRALGGFSSQGPHRQGRAGLRLDGRAGNPALHGPLVGTERRRRMDVPGTGSTGLSDGQFFPTGGRVMNVTGGYTGFVFQEQAVRAFEFTGPGLIYRFQEIDGAQGCIAPYAVASMGAYAWYLGERGFNQIGPDGPKPIGATRIDDWWRNNTDAVPSIPDRGRGRSGRAPHHLGGLCHLQLHQLRRGRDLRLATRPLDRVPGRGAVVGRHCHAGHDVGRPDDGSLDDLPFSLDSRVWEGNKPTWGGINSSGQLIFMAGLRWRQP